MADASDVESALAMAAAAAIYPGGAAGAPVGGYACRIMRGSPNAEALNADLAAGVVNVAVTAVDRMARNTTRYVTNWHGLPPTAPTLAVTVTGGVAGFSGSGGGGMIVGVQSVGVGYTYVTVAGDTPGSIAAALAAALPGATATEATLALPTGGGPVAAAVYGNAGAASEVRRQEQGFRLAVLAATPDARTAVATTIDQALAGIDFLALSDGSAGRLRYHETRIDDVPSRADLWRRDLTYTVEYATLLQQSVPPMVFGRLAINGAAAGTTPPAPPASQ